MNHIDESIMVALQDRADGGVHVEDLLAGARHRGQRRKRVRRTLAGAGAGALTLAVLGAVAVLPTSARTPDPGPVVADRPAVSPPGRPPVADAPVLGQGGIAGRDGLFHLDHDGPEAASWESGPGWELMETSTDTAHYRTAIADSTANLDKALAASGDELTHHPTSTPVTVGGRAATFVWSGMNPADGARWGYLRWQPVTGTWALVFSTFAADPGTNAGTDQAKLVAYLETVRFDRVYRCAVNFRITWAPPGAAVTTCTFRGGKEPTARVQISSGAASFSVSAGPASATAAKPVKPTTDFAGTPVEYTDAGRVRRVAGDQVVTLDQGDVLLAGNDALRLAAGVQPVTAADPAAWPADPLH